MAFATYQDLEDRLRVTFDAAEQVQATALLDAATALVKAAAGQQIDQVNNDTVTLYGTGTGVLLLPEIPVTAVSTVVDWDGSTLTFDTDYRWTTQGVLIRLTAATWRAGGHIITVTYTHGYASTPADLQAVTVEAAARAWSTPAGAVKAETIGSYSVTYDTGSTATSGLALTDAERMAVARYSAGAFA